MHRSYLPGSRLKHASNPRQRHPATKCKAWKNPSNKREGCTSQDLGFDKGHTPGWRWGPTADVNFPVAWWSPSHVLPVSKCFVSSEVWPQGCKAQNCVMIIARGRLDPGQHLESIYDQIRKAKLAKNDCGFRSSEQNYHHIHIKWP